MILGSQSILGKYPSPPEPLCRSIEADAYPLNAPEKTDLLSIDDDRTREAAQIIYDRSLRTIIETV